MITKEQLVAMNGHGELHHVRLTNADKKTPLRARLNGKIQLWVRGPKAGLWRQPMKHGLRNTFQLWPAEAADWVKP